MLFYDIFFMHFLHYLGHQPLIITHCTTTILKLLATMPVSTATAGEKKQFFYFKTIGRKRLNYLCFLNMVIEMEKIINIFLCSENKTGLEFVCFYNKHCFTL